MERLEVPVSVEGVEQRYKVSCNGSPPAMSAASLLLTRTQQCDIPVPNRKVPPMYQGEYSG